MSAGLLKRVRSADRGNRNRGVLTASLLWVDDEVISRKEPETNVEGADKDRVRSPPRSPVTLTSCFCCCCGYVSMSRSYKKVTKKSNPTKWSWSV